jgi:hypothetical protein
LKQGRLQSDYQGMDKPPRKNVPAGRYWCKSGDDIP